MINWTSPNLGSKVDTAGCMNTVPHPLLMGTLNPASHVGRVRGYIIFSTILGAVDSVPAR